MAKSADIGSKRLISLDPDAWVRWVMGDRQLRAGEILDPQFQWVSRDSDVLLRVTCPIDGDFLLLNELQLRYDASIIPIREAVRRLRQEERLDELEPLLAFFASFVLELPLVQQIMRWDMTVLQQSPWYEEILNRGQVIGLKEGIEQGIQQGIEQGIEQEKCRVIPRLLAKEFTIEEIAEIVGDSVESVTKIIRENQWRSPDNQPEN